MFREKHAGLLDHPIVYDIFTGNTALNTVSPGFDLTSNCPR